MKKKQAASLLFIFLTIIAPLNGDPWGKDADLNRKKTISFNEKTCSTPILGQIAEKLIHFHQTTISPADGPRSNYKPSSSQYALDAMRKYGFFKGFMMGCDRLMRENKEKWVYRTAVDEYGTLIKIDPVP